MSTILVIIFYYLYYVGLQFFILFCRNITFIALCYYAVYMYLICLGLIVDMKISYN